MPKLQVFKGVCCLMGHRWVDPERYSSFNRLAEEEKLEAVVVALEEDARCLGFSKNISVARNMLEGTYGSDSLTVSYILWWFLV